MAAQEAETSRNEPNGSETPSGLEAAQFASQCSVAEMTPFLYASDVEVLNGLLANPLFGEREALLLLNRRDLPSAVVEQLASLRSILNSNAVKRALTKRPSRPVR